jgi:hypothetical protein
MFRTLEMMTLDLLCLYSNTVPKYLEQSIRDTQPVDEDDGLRTSWKWGALGVTWSSPSETPNLSTKTTGYGHLGNGGLWECVRDPEKDLGG